MVVDIRTSREALDTGTPRDLLNVSVPGDAGDNPYPYDVTPDGQRFLVEENAGMQTSVPLTVLVNWQAKLKP